MHGTCIKMIAEVKNVWSCTSTLPCDFVFMAWRLIHCMDELSRFLPLYTRTAPEYRKSVHEYVIWTFRNK